MTLKKIGMTLFGAAIAIMVNPHLAKADDIDPFFNETVTNSCPANCLETVLGTDPISGKTTVEYIMKNTGQAPFQALSPATCWSTRISSAGQSAM
jgi:hypothetical protein